MANQNKTGSVIPNLYKGQLKSNNRLLEEIAANTANGGSSGEEPSTVKLDASTDLGSLGSVQVCTLRNLTTAGTIAAGAKVVSFENLGTEAVAVAGGSLPAGKTITFATTVGTLGAIAYGAGTLLVLEQR